MPIGHNTVEGEKLLGFVERLERIDAEKKTLGGDRKVIMAEAKAAGYNTSAISACIKIRSKKPSEVQESQAILDTYMHALGLAPEPPLFRAMGLLGADEQTREAIIKSLEPLVPLGGEIIVRAKGKPVRLWRDDTETVHHEDYTPPAATFAPTPKQPASPAATAVPDVDDEGARELGRKAARDDQPVTENPFPFGDKRRQLFDMGWREANGGDGMGPPSS